MTNYPIEGRRVLVTGGNGFIGSALIRGLLGEGAVIRSFDNDSRGSRTKLGDAVTRIEIVRGDVRDRNALRRAAEGMEWVCHLAYINGTEYFYSHPELILEVAVKGMINVLDTCIEAGIRTFILASSSEVYQNAAAIPTDERVALTVPDVTNPRYSYGGGKIISELLLVNYARKHFDRAVIFRPHNVYGPDMGREHVIPQFALRLRDLAELTTGVINFPIQGNGSETRAFIYVDDFVDAILRIIKFGEPIGIYHVGTDQETSIRELALMSAECYGREIRIISGEGQPGSPSRRCPDTTKLRALGFNPQVSLRDGLARTIRWYRDHP